MHKRSATRLFWACTNVTELDSQLNNEYLSVMLEAKCFKTQTIYENVNEVI